MIFKKKRKPFMGLRWSKEEIEAGGRAGDRVELPKLATLFIPILYVF
jgi:hypothetical protein